MPHEQCLPIHYAEEANFIKPCPPTFSTISSIGSIGSLFLFSLIAALLLFQTLFSRQDLFSGLSANIGVGLLTHLFVAPNAGPASDNLPFWTWAPFFFALLGSALGCVFECGLLFASTPFQQKRSSFSTFIFKLRLLNLAPVFVSVFLFFCGMAINEPALRVALLFLAGALGSGLAFALFFDGAEQFVASSLLGLLIVEIFMAVVAGPLPGGSIVKYLLVAQPILQMTALMIGTETPSKSIGFHIFSAAGLVLLYLVLVAVSHTDPTFFQNVFVGYSAATLRFWTLMLACFGGSLTTLKMFPRTYARLRENISNIIWPPFYYMLTGGPRFPKPFKLSQAYTDKNNPPVAATLWPYSLAHPRRLPQPLSIPALAKAGHSLLVFGKVYWTIKKLFSIISFVNYIFPQADTNVPLKYKPRMERWSDGTDFWPSILLGKFFGFSVPEGAGGLGIQRTTDVALDAFRKGQLLAFMTEYGIGATFAKPDPARGPGALIADFRFLENYETKPDYESYGGVAYFRVNSSKKCLELESVIAPHSSEVIRANPNDPTFRHAESMVIASLYYQVVSGKHLAEIHMTYNLIEVAMYNAFDAKQMYRHPIRIILYLHFFSHSLAEELTTENLVEEGGVFAQIFATTQDSLIRHLNDCYHAFQFGEDENIDDRIAALRMKGPAGKFDGDVLPNASINWELCYMKIWQKYATALVEIIYKDDLAVQGDRNLQDFHNALLNLLLNGLPSRYDGFQSKKGVALFISDTIHHVVVRHEVYGSTGVRLALDPRINNLQIPRDGGTNSVDEWRSLACVSLATSRVRFTSLLNDFKYLLEDVEAKFRPAMAKVYDQLQDDLKDLETAWNSNETDKKRNFEYLRPTPSELDTGAGY